MTGWLAVVALAAQAAAPAPVTLDLSAAQVLELASAKAEAGDTAGAITLFTALAKDPDVDIRSEARFRHGRLLETQRKFGDAAVLYRAILDERPGAQRVRLQLAQALLLAGKEGQAAQALRQAQAAGLPPDITRIVAQFQSALRAIQPVGGSLELALAPASNINRAPRSATLDTIIAPLQLSEDGQAQSGLGVKLAGQGFVRLPLSKRLRWTARASGQGFLYGKDQFNDIAASLETGVEWSIGTSRLQPSFGHTRRWFGGRPFTVANTASLSWLRPLDKRTQLDVTASAGHNDFIQNDLQDGAAVDVGVALERAFDARSGGRISLSAQRLAARDPGYASVGGGVNLLYYREAGRSTLFLSAGLSHLGGDDRLFLFPKRRIEWLVRTAAGITLRQVQVKGFSPVIRVSHERNFSTVGLFDFARTGVDIGITRAF